MFIPAVPFTLLLLLTMAVTPCHSIPYCGQALNKEHARRGRAYINKETGKVIANRSGTVLGSPLETTLITETKPGHFEITKECPRRQYLPYDHHKEATMETLLDLKGNLGIVMTGGHFLESFQEQGKGFPRDLIVKSTRQMQIPEGSQVKHAFLYYGGIIGMAGFDFTPDDLGSFEDIKTNNISFEVNGKSFGPFNPTDTQPDDQSAAGSEAKMSDTVFHPTYGTLTNTKVSFWSNRLDITGILKNYSGKLSLTINPPDKIDRDVNDASQHAGNPAGATSYNSCLNAANWGLIVIYENKTLDKRQLIVKDGLILAWDYPYFHKGFFLRPKVTFERHSPMKQGTRFYALAQTGNLSGSQTPDRPFCTCGCGGCISLVPGQGYDRTSMFWSQVVVDPEETVNDPIHRDSTNGPWRIDLRMDHNPHSLRGNDWTLVESGKQFTEFPNLFEGEPVEADGIEPITWENIPDTLGEVYGGHPWEGRGEVIYHGTGNDLTAVEVRLDDSALTTGATETSFYFKGDQKDVFKPQTRINLRMLILSIPL